MALSRRQWGRGSQELPCTCQVKVAASQPSGSPQGVLGKWAEWPFCASVPLLGTMMLSAVFPERITC